MQTPNLHLELFEPLGTVWRGDATAGALLDENMAIIDAAAVGSGGTSVKVNGATVNTPNFNGATPTAPAGYTNVTWQVSGSSVSAYVATAQPAGSSGNIQYNAGASFGAVASFSIRPTSGEVTIIDTAATTTNLAALTVQGDAQGDDIQDWYTSNGTIGEGADAAYIDSTGVVNTLAGIRNFKAYVDASDSPGTSGQLLSSTVTGTKWIKAPSGGVASVFGRTGSVTAMSGDYTVAKVTGAAPLASPTFTGTVSGITYTMVGADASGAAAAALVTAKAYTDSETSRAETAEALLVPQTTTVNGHALSANVVVSASDLTTGTLPHAQLPALLSGDIPNNAANTSGTAANLSGTPALPNGTTATTQLLGDDTNKLATTAFVYTAAATVLASAEFSAAVTYIPLSTMLANGDMIYENASLGPVRLPIGSNGQVLTSNGSDPVWGSPVWNIEGNATGNLTLANANFTSTFNQTSGVAWLWANTTTATSGTTNASPLLEVAANYYTGSTSAQDLWTLGAALAAGTNAISTLTLAHSGSTGTPVFKAPGFTPTVIGAAGLFGLYGNGQNLTLCGVTSSTWILEVINANNSGQWGIGYNSGYFVGHTSNLPLVWTNSVSSPSTTVDTSLSRQSAGVLAIGVSNTVGDSTGNLQLNKITKYAGTATVSQGVPAEYAVSDFTAQSAAITATTLLSAPQTGMYRISWCADITTASDISSVLGGAGGFEVLYTSPTDSVGKTTVAGNSITSAANTTGTAVGGSITVYAKTGTNIQFTYGYTDSHTSTAMVYELHIKVEAL